MQSGIIYRIYSQSLNKCYIGSTFKDVNKRLKKHEGNYKDYLRWMEMEEMTRPKYIKILSSYEVLKNNDYKIEVIDKIITNDRKKLETLEYLYIHIYSHENIVNRKKKMIKFKNLDDDDIKERMKKHYIIKF